MAGIVAGTKGGSLTIEGCVFDGTMTGSTNTRCAGIAGYEYIATTTVISNTLFAPTTLTVSTPRRHHHQLLLHPAPRRSAGHRGHLHVPGPEQHRH